MTEQNIRAVRNQRMKEGGEHEHQDVEPHVLDVQQNAQQVPESGPDEDDYLPDYQSDSQELPDYQPSDEMNCQNDCQPEVNDVFQGNELLWPASQTYKQ